MYQPSSTKNRVKILSESLINKIAAGEVVERPASVVKELLENAIDAGATEVQVTIKNGGKDLISILDNGCGMNEENAQLAVERHATSKIIDEDDLFRIRTLGFRGEALAAIASVSHFELLTCNDETQRATRIFIKGGHLEQVGKIGFPNGTKVTVERLFYNTPARLKFLKTNATELQHIQQNLIQKSLAHPHIHFRLTHNSQLLLNLPGGQVLETRIHQLFGLELKEILMSVKHEETYLQYSGFISFPSKPRTSRRWQYIFVNDRNVKSPSINHGIYDGYGTFLGKGQHPIFFLNLRIEPKEIDVNVHPAKTEIRFRNNQLVHTILVDQISRSLKDSASRRFFGREHSQSQMLRTEPSGQIELPMTDPLTLGNSSSGRFFSSKKKHISETRDLPPRGSQKQKKIHGMSIYPQEKLIAEIKPIPKNTQDYDSETNLENLGSAHGKRPGTHIRNTCLISPLSEVPQRIRLLGQFRKTYIISENEAGLVVIDQQALYERLIYDTYLKSMRKKDLRIQTFKVSLLMELSSHESELLEQFLDPLALSGFGINAFGRNTFTVETIPEFLRDDQVKKVIMKILDRLVLSSKRDHNDEILKDICQVLAAHCAKFSEYDLSKSEMNCLLAKWEELGSPVTSINDNPILMEFSLQELEKKFIR